MTATNLLGATRFEGAGTHAVRLLRTLAQCPSAALVLMMSSYFGVFATLATEQHAGWRSLGFDTAIHDQGIWLTAHGRTPFVTVRGIDYFGHHVNLISLLFVPIYRLGGGVRELTLIHTAWVALAALPLWLLARDRIGGRGWLALVVPAAYLLHPATQWITWWLYHPDSMAILPLVFAWWLATRRRWGWFAVAIAVAIACKEDVALAVVAMGLALAVLRPGGRTLDRAVSGIDGRRRVGGGLLTAAAGLGWFLLCTRWVIPARTGASQPFYESFFPSLGASPSQIATNAMHHPSRVTHLLGRDKNGSYLARMVGPLGLIPIVALPVLAPGLPQLGVNLLVETVDGATIVSQYATLPLVGLLLATVEGLGLIRRRLGPRALRGACGVLAASAITGSALWGCGPFSANWANGAWARPPRPEVATLDRVQRMVPGDAGVAASYDIDAHFSHRVVDYEWPNPWHSANYGMDGASFGTPTQVEWIIITAAGAGTRADLELLDQLLGPGGGFAEVMNERGVFVARRIAPSLPLAADGRPPTDSVTDP